MFSLPTIPLLKNQLIGDVLVFSFDSKFENKKRYYFFDSKNVSSKARPTVLPPTPPESSKHLFEREPARPQRAHLRGPVLPRGAAEPTLECWRFGRLQAEGGNEVLKSSRANLFGTGIDAIGAKFR